MDVSQTLKELCFREKKRNWTVFRLLSSRESWSSYTKVYQRVTYAFARVAIPRNDLAERGGGWWSGSRSSGGGRGSGGNVISVRNIVGDSLRLVNADGLGANWFLT